MIVCHAIIYATVFNASTEVLTTNLTIKITRYFMFYIPYHIWYAAIKWKKNPIDNDVGPLEGNFGKNTR